MWLTLDDGVCGAAVVCLRGRAPSFSGRAGGEEIPLLFPRKPIGCVRLIKETQKWFEAEG